MPKKSKEARRGPKRGGRNKGEGGSERTGYSQKMRAKKRAEGSKSRGCPLQLMILSMPFVAAAAFWFLRS